MQALPATNGDLTPIQRKWVDAASEEVAYWEGYANYLRATVAAGQPSKASAERVESLRSRLQALNDEAGSKLGVLFDRLGGDAAFHGRIDLKRVEEIRASLKAQTAG